MFLTKIHYIIIITHLIIYLKSCETFLDEPNTNVDIIKEK